MGTIKRFRYILLLIVIAGIVFIFNPFQTIENKVLYEIYRTEHANKLSIYRLIRKTPPNFKKYFKISLGSTDNYVRIDFVNSSISRYYNYCYIDFKNIQKDGFLYAPPHFRCIGKPEDEWMDYLSYLVNNELFSAFLENTEGVIINSDECEEIYLKFIGKAVSNDLFYFLKDNSELSKVLLQYPKTPNTSHLYFRLIENINNLQFVSTSSTKYFWGQGCGLFELTNNECDIRIRFLGLLGNEHYIL